MLKKFKQKLNIWQCKNIFILLTWLQAIIQKQHSLDTINETDDKKQKLIQKNIKVIKYVLSK